jgi:hypothetical protein
VVLYGIEAYVEFFGDLGVGATLEDEGEDLFLFGRQPGLTGSLPETYRGLFFVPCGQEPDALSGLCTLYGGLQ